MRNNIRYHVSVAVCFARLAIQRQLEYPLFLMSWLFMIPIQYFAGAYMLNILVTKFQPLAGWSFPQLAFVYGLGLLSHGLQVVLFIQTWGFDNAITNGGFDRMLLRPMNVFFQFSVQYINFIGLIDLIPGVIIFSYGCIAVGFQWTLENTIKVILVVAGGVLIRASIYTAISSIAFWTKRSWPLVSLGITLMERTTFYPLSIYPYMAQALLTFILPIAFICFYPACDFLAQDDRFSLPLGLAIWTPVVGLITFFAAHKIFKVGLGKYESSGS